MEEIKIKKNCPSRRFGIVSEIRIDEYNVRSFIP